MGQMKDTKIEVEHELIIVTRKDGKEEREVIDDGKQHHDE
jgi:hypothetical protein